MKSGVLQQRLLNKRGTVEGKVKTLKNYKVKRLQGHGGQTCNFTLLLFGFLRVDASSFQM